MVHFYYSFQILTVWDLVLGSLTYVGHTLELSFESWAPCRRSASIPAMDAATAAAVVRLGFIVIVNAFAASSMLAALVLQSPRLFAAGLVFVLGWLGCYALTVQGTIEAPQICSI